MFGVTKLELDLISDVDRYLFFKKEMKDGVSYIYKRYIKTNNKYGTSHDSNKPTKHILQMDKNYLLKTRIKT